MSDRDPGAEAFSRRQFIHAVLLGAILIDPGLVAGHFEARAQSEQTTTGTRVRRAPQLSEVEQLKVFEEVWQTVRDRFYDKTLHGLDWEQVRERYRPLVAAARSEQDRSRLINSMLGELGASHTEYYTPDEQAYYELLSIFSGPLRTRLQQIFPNGEVSYVGIGAYVQQLGGKIFTTGVLAGQPADRAGLRVGDEIVDVDGKPYQPIASFLGIAQQNVILHIRRQPDGPLEPLTVVPQIIHPNEAFLEAMERSVRVIDKNGFRIGYIHIWSYAAFSYQKLLMQELQSGALKDAQALVLDLRDGWGGAQLDYLQPFIGRLPAMSVIGRNGKEELENVRWGKPVAMLVNEGTRSGKEILADAFERYGLGPVVGSHTAKAVLGARAFLMSDDSLLLLAVADVVLDGRRLEGVGVEPTVPVPFRIEYANGRDPQLDKAVSILAGSL
jgi:carboxyl-terminal processing protease